MYICYLDESGVPENTATTHFVLTGLAIPGEQWKAFESDVANCKKPYGLNDAEVHAAWVGRRYLEQERILDFEKLSWPTRKAAALVKRDESLIKLAARGTAASLKEAKKNHRKTHDYLHLTYDERRQLLRSLADVIGGWTNARLFTEVIDKRHAYSFPAHRFPPFEYAFHEVVQRFENFLRNRGRALNQDLFGMIVQDNNETMAKRLTKMMRDFHTEGTRWMSINCIIETPLFVDSHLTSMVQMADLCGYAIRRYIENSETDLFDRIYPRVDRANQTVVGARHFTAVGCNCRICQDHR
jgi:hypothetical protein